MRAILAGAGFRPAKGFRYLHKAAHFAPPIRLRSRPPAKVEGQVGRRLSTTTLRRLGLFALVGFVGLGIPVRKEAQTPGRAAAASPVPQARDWMARYARLALGFEPNRGQADRQVKFLARGPGYTLFLTRDGAALSVKSRQSFPRSGISRQSQETTDTGQRLPAEASAQAGTTDNRRLYNSPSTFRNS